MNYNFLSYLIYLPIIFYIILVVGFTFYKNGQHYIEGILPYNPALVRVINRMLLLGYYLINLGYVAVTISFWQPVNSIQQMFEILAVKTGFILVLLGLLHFNNLFCLWWFREKLKTVIN